MLHDNPSSKSNRMMTTNDRGDYCLRKRKAMSESAWPAVFSARQFWQLPDFGNLPGAPLGLGRVLVMSMRRKPPDDKFLQHIGDGR